MNEPNRIQPSNDNGRAIILATTLVVMTCILSCTAVMLVLVLRLP